MVGGSDKRLELPPSSDQRTLDGVSTLVLIAVDGGSGRSDSEVGVKDKSSSESSDTAEEGRGIPEISSEDTDEGEEIERSVTEGGAVEVGGGNETAGGERMDGTWLGTGLRGGETGGSSGSGKWTD